jgi:hypothetical protein
MSIAIPLALNLFASHVPLHLTQAPSPAALQRLLYRRFTRGISSYCEPGIQITSEAGYSSPTRVCPEERSRMHRLRVDPKLDRKTSLETVRAVGECLGQRPYPGSIDLSGHGSLQKRYGDNHPKAALKLDQKAF